MSSLPKLTNPLRPVARYRKGQQPANAPSDSDSDEEAVEQPSEGEEELKPTVVKKEVKAKMAVALREVEVDKGGVVRVGGKGEVGRTERELESSEDEGEYHLGCAASCTDPGSRDGERGGRAGQEDVCRCWGRRGRGASLETLRA